MWENEKDWNIERSKDLKSPCFRYFQILGRFIPVAEFINEFHERIEDFTVQYEDFAIAGDGNNHVESDESSSRKFKNLMEMSSFPIDDLQAFLEYLALLIPGLSKLT